MKDATIQVSLGDPRLKEISEVMASKTCNKILDALVDGSKTASELSRTLKAAQNTVDYNLKKLLKAGLIEKADSWWSVKGKKMPSYGLSNKKIIIEPRRHARKPFLIAFGLLILVAFAVSFIEEPASSSPSLEDFSATTEFAGIQETARLQTDDAKIVPNKQVFQSFKHWEWFLLGGFVGISLFTAVARLLARRRHG